MEAGNYRKFWRERRTHAHLKAFEDMGRKVDIGERKIFYVRIRS